MNTKRADRRKPNKWRLTITASIVVTILTSCAYVVYAAGKASEKIESMQKDVTDLEGYKTKAIVSAEQITQLSKAQEKSARILEKLDDRLDSIELKLERQIHSK